MRDIVCVCLSLWAYWATVDVILSRYHLGRKLTCSAIFGDVDMWICGYVNILCVWLFLLFELLVRIGLRITDGGYVEGEGVFYRCI